MNLRFAIWDLRAVGAAVLLAGAALLGRAAELAKDYFQIRVLDSKTGRGVPLVELETVNKLKFVTDSAGRVAFHEPGLMGREVYFHVRSHGYEFAKDGFGNRGVRLTPRAGGSAEVKLKRLNIAERLYRVTGDGIYRDTVLLGERAPIENPLNAGFVAGQDSVQVAPYRGRLFWFWGDTARMSYPLGQFRTAGATSVLPQDGLDPAVGINLRYFTNADGFSRPMVPLEKNEGVVWIDGLLTVNDDTGRERLVTRYSRLKSLTEKVEQGIAAYNDEKDIFERVSKADLSEKWRLPHDAPVRHRDGGTDYYYFGYSARNVRVKADWKSVLDPGSYEAFTCASAADKLARDAGGQLQWSWQRALPPADGAAERQWIKAGKMKQSEARFLPDDAETGKPVSLHFGTVRWNEHRQRWILVAVQQGGASSYLGEVYYGESRDITGPWKRVRKIITHEKYSFYNPVHHAMFDQAGGRLIYIEGTYTETFSGNPIATPRYDYNQMMYRLDLDDERLRGVRE